MRKIIIRTFSNIFSMLFIGAIISGIFSIIFEIAPNNVSLLAFYVKLSFIVTAILSLIFFILFRVIFIDYWRKNLIKDRISLMALPITISMVYGILVVFRFQVENNFDYDWKYWLFLAFAIGVIIISPNIHIKNIKQIEELINIKERKEEKKNEKELKEKHNNKKK